MLQFAARSLFTYDKDITLVRCKLMVLVITVSPVSAERGCAVTRFRFNPVDLSPAAIRPHLRRAGLPPLAARP